LKNADFGRDSLCLFTGTERSFLFMKIKKHPISKRYISRGSL